MQPTHETNRFSLKTSAHVNKVLKYLWQVMYYFFSVSPLPIRAADNNWLKRQRTTCQLGVGQIYIDSASFEKFSESVKYEPTSTKYLRLASANYNLTFFLIMVIRSLVLFNFISLWSLDRQELMTSFVVVVQLMLNGPSARPCRQRSQKGRGIDYETLRKGQTGK